MNRGKKINLTDWRFDEEFYDNEKILARENKQENKARKAFKKYTENNKFIEQSIGRK